MHETKQVRIWYDRGPNDNYTVSRINLQEGIGIDPGLNAVTRVVSAASWRILIFKPSSEYTFRL